jgi:hypothetical protein
MMAYKTTEAKRAAAHRWYQNHKAERDAYTLKHHAQIKEEVLTHYGNGHYACVTCGEDRPPCLTIDHINNDGMEERRKIKKYGANFYKSLKRQGYPTGYQTMCMNCQFLKLHAHRQYLRSLGERRVKE